MRIESVLTPQEIKLFDLTRKTAVLIDVLRSNSCLVTALSNGCRKIIPALNPQEAFAIAKKYPPETTLLGGESGGYRIEGFDLGNSPFDYTEQAVRGKTIIFTSSNGMASLLALQSCRRIFVGSFLNLNSVKKTLIAGVIDGQDILLVCAGNRGKISLEDALCAGMLSREISTASSIKPERDDSTRSAEALALVYRDKVAEVLVNCSWGRELQRIGITIPELEYCARIDSIPLVPYVTPDFSIEKYPDGKRQCT